MNYTNTITSTGEQSLNRDKSSTCSQNGDKAAIGNEIHVVEQGQTMYEISQIYGVKLEIPLQEKLMVEGEQPLEGTEIYLRKKKREPLIKLEPIGGAQDEDEMQFRFERPLELFKTC